MNLIDKVQGELPFWLRLMKEHAFFLELGFPATREALARRAGEFVLVFDRLLSRSRLVRNQQEARELVQDTKKATAALLNFKREVLNLIIQCQMRLSVYALLVDHIAREAMRLLELLEEWENNYSQWLLCEALDEERFWSRIMTDHAKFIKHLLDPSQRSLIATAEKWSLTFDNLYRVAEDYCSMLQASPESFLAVNSFTDELLENTRGIAAFKRAGRDALLNCGALATAIPLLMDHVMREAEHFHSSLTVLRQRLEVENVPSLPPENPLPPNTPPFT
jgi:hypothetical protein